MKYRFVLFFAALIVGLTAYSFIFPGYISGQILGMSEPIVLARLLMVGVIVMYVISARVRTVEMQLFMRMSGMLLIGYGITAMMSPVLFGLTNSYIPIGDVAIWLEGGITATLLSYEVPPQITVRDIARQRRIKFLVAPFSSRGSMGHP